MAGDDLQRVRSPLRDQQTISASWDRCLHQYGLDQWSRRHETVVRRERVRDSIESLGPLFSACRSQVQHIFQNIVGSGHAVILTDKSGTIIEFAVQSALDDLFRQSGLRRGADWSESREGTNGIGTAIAEKKSLTVYRDQHFHNDHASLTCTGAPVFDVMGDVLALFDVSSIGRKDDPEILAHTRALLEMSARLITRRNFQDHFADQWIVRFHRDAERVGLLEEGLLALDHNGIVVGADQQAITHLSAMDRSQLVGASIEELFKLQSNHLPASLSGEGRAPARLSVTDAFEQGNHAVHARLIEPNKAKTRGEQRTLAPRSAKVQPGSAFGKRGTLARSPLEELVGDDCHLKDVVDKAIRLFDHDVPLLISGETGAGKDSFAKALHQSSSRASQPFIAVNCGALPENLIEGELFGYKAGAFTGAQSSGFKGQLLAANGGTLLLDEIGDMPLSAQTRLLQVLERRQVTPLGSTEGVDLDIRLLAATHQPLAELIRQGRFREDLYYRICGFTLSLPPLRKRADLDHLIARLVPGLDLYNEDHVSGEARVMLETYDWPGNIRQLKHVLKTAVILADDSAIAPDHLHIHENECGDDRQLGIVRSVLRQDTLQSRLDFSHQESQVIKATLVRNKWNVSRAAAQLGVSRNTLYRKMKLLGISREI